MAHTVFIRGIPERPEIVDVRVRDQPGLNSNTKFRALLNATAQVSEIRLDPANDKFQGQTYRWFFLTFADGRNGWVRDDLLDVQGNLTAFGYPIVPLRGFAFSVAKNLPPPTSGTVPLSPPPVVVSPPPAAPPATPPPPASPPATVPASTSCIGTVRQDIQAKVRAQPSLNGERKALLEPRTRVRIVQVVPGQDGQPFRWAKISAVGLEGFIREDLMTYSDECSGLGLKTTSSPPSPPTSPPAAPSGGTLPMTLFTTPVQGNYTVTQEFGNRHRGADLAGSVSIPIIAGGNAIVYRATICTRCTSDRPNFRSQGIPDWDENAIHDRAWGFGFGNFVTLRYAWGDLPAQTRQILQGMRLPGAFVYVIYAHLSRIDVQLNAPVGGGTQLGLLGNTGNSTGAHLHLEVHASMSDAETAISDTPLLNPRSMFTF
jgi:murein DD-endopeptidase MepM/ murein hydrolase activator NlpD